MRYTCIKARRLPFAKSGVLGTLWASCIWVGTVIGRISRAPSGARASNARGGATGSPPAHSDECDEDSDRTDGEWLAAE